VRVGQAAQGGACGLHTEEAAPPWPVRRTAGHLWQDVGARRRSPLTGLAGRAPSGKTRTVPVP